MCLAAANATAAIVYVKMDAGNFYGARNPSCRSRGPYDYDYPSDLIPEAVTTPQRPTAGMIQVNQKLDRLLGMMGEQQKETNSVKSAMKTIREEFDSLRATVSSFSTPSSADTSVSKRPQRLPLKLSVSNQCFCKHSCSLPSYSMDGLQLANVLVSLARPLFSIFPCGGGKKGLVHYC